jgi:hypothetical protein
MSNEDMSKCVWDSCDRNKWQQNPNYRPAQSVHQQCGLAVESVLKNSLYRQSLDNVTVVMIGFQNFKRIVFGKSKNSEREEQLLAKGDLNTIDYVRQPTAPSNPTIDHNQRQRHQPQTSINNLPRSNSI